MMIACRRLGSVMSTPTLLEILHALLAGADPALEDEDGGLAIHFAAARCDTQVVQLLLSKAPSTLNHATHFGWTPLAAAADGGRESTMCLLLSAGASDSLVRATKGVTAFHGAVRSGKIRSVRFLLENGLDAVGGFQLSAERWAFR
ncbi:similar to ankyrin 2,3/unc44 [Ectocarpus siliculosus]|uniref:Similar to ankyrin 2,3/unc44 n=1 Tax=Ectocarpus siliculosus TaxID=2880 RepID=D8LMB0_ECTSI|nr:similar to ankyrin 2,3/unc44 [Ectocarpus siliculosus]|eukprot:CBN77520.1 similar to ankyrin 2,3/unc44 [Ectocarpus siliculosus]